jgi:hypothetical protein
MEGSRASTRSVENRPDWSISRRLITPTGETVAVPIDFTFTFCGINDPVTNTYLSLSAPRALDGSANATGANVTDIKSAAAPFTKNEDLMHDVTAEFFNFNLS